MMVIECKANFVGKDGLKGQKISAQGNALGNHNRWVVDIFVVIGTSLVVYPAAGLVNYAHDEIPKFLIDPGDMQGRLPEGFHHIQKTAVEGIDILKEDINNLGV